MSAKEGQVIVPANPEEVVATHGTEPATVDPWWERVERVTKILSQVAIPVVIAIFGWLIQNSLARRNVAQEYVRIALNILTEKGKDNPLLRDWAVDLLSQNSPTPFSPDCGSSAQGRRRVSASSLGAIVAVAGGIASCLA
jgi:hypothetical protein